MSDQGVAREPVPQEDRVLHLDGQLDEQLIALPQQAFNNLLEAMLRAQEQRRVIRYRLYRYEADVERGR
ncbi:unnamed protein product [Gongylonema pulchrum]|uniref:Sigma70_r1_2 domain-containing protein n=1 Tax=Gongylonema pulchrum TaxID=637853 RepID=A0A183EWH8_9BILA|nr:unnamed protein product [Gongylonema pulchrum]